jgi:hypothetical protein
MTKKNLKTVAEEYLKDQFAIMEKHGGGPKISRERYRELVINTESRFAALRPRNDSGRSTKQTN